MCKFELVHNYSMATVALVWVSTNGWPVTREVTPRKNTNTGELKIIFLANWLLLFGKMCDLL